MAGRGCVASVVVSLSRRSLSGWSFLYTLLLYISPASLSFFSFNILLFVSK